jgi:hypothetical protein
VIDPTGLHTVTFQTVSGGKRDDRAEVDAFLVEFEAAIRSLGDP